MRKFAALRCRVCRVIGFESIQALECRLLGQTVSTAMQIRQAVVVDVPIHVGAFYLCFLFTRKLDCERATVPVSVLQTTQIPHPQQTPPPPRRKTHPPAVTTFSAQQAPELVHRSRISVSRIEPSFKLRSFVCFLFSPPAISVVSRDFADYFRFKHSLHVKHATRPTA